MTDGFDFARGLVGREFVHFKGGHYRLHALATDTETRETVVVYEALYGDGGLWVRPAKMFFEDVTRDGKTFPRFRLLEESQHTVDAASCRVKEEGSPSSVVRGETPRPRGSAFPAQAVAGGKS